LGYFFTQLIYISKDGGGGMLRSLWWLVVVKKHHSEKKRKERAKEIDIEYRIIRNDNIASQQSVVPTLLCVSCLHTCVRVGWAGCPVIPAFYFYFFSFHNGHEN
jgi:hypothetical protein